ncbi:hypothetical protein [Desulforhopalus singaporensis]|uniref:Phage-associated protein, BcepMu gp16 family n=1 Tax=Desulforhopalus singaporensis TaxID=91360 RepID=A0A1H0UVJ7_9BACT|nr:hypothetical protein [Desulforhopalus singaporensis]SDP70234.1 hypothetical protein SAMN05660330_03752 [Desulforhopalus singaporensis]SDP70327.1 hypothetical protein SAMN05660330_03757 [Desulforhopalus singaporensis]
MNSICRRMWDKNLTMRKWSELNGFNHRYVQVVISGKRGSWNAGKAKKIKQALIDQGFATKEEVYQ